MKPPDQSALFPGSLIAARWVVLLLALAITVPLTLPIEMAWRRGEPGLMGLALFAAYFLLAVAIFPLSPRILQWFCFAAAVVAVLPYGLQFGLLHFLANTCLHWIAAIILIWDYRIGEQTEEPAQQK